MSDSGFSEQQLLRMAAYHESGHAIMNYVLGAGVREVCIYHGGGVTHQIRSIKHRDRIRMKCAGAVTELMAEEIASPAMTAVALSSSCADRSQCVDSLVWLYSAEGALLGPQLSEQQSQEWAITRWLAFQDEIRELFTRPQYASALHDLANNLLGTEPKRGDVSGRRCLNGDQVTAILRQHLVLQPES